MNYFIRAMKFSDIEQVYKIECRVFPIPWPKTFFENDLQKQSVIAFVADDNKELILGYGLANCIDIELHITNIAVDPSWQNQGIGTMILLELEKVGRERGCLTVYLEVRVNNSKAIKFYNKLGYRILMTRKYYYLDGADAYVMTKEFKNM